MKYATIFSSDPFWEADQARAREVGDATPDSECKPGRGNHVNVNKNVG
jgi:hypothetical protein